MNLIWILYATMFKYYHKVKKWKWDYKPFSLLMLPMLIVLFHLMPHHYSQVVPSLHSQDVIGFSFSLQFFLKAHFLYDSPSKQVHLATFFHFPQGVPNVFPPAVQIDPSLQTQVEIGLLLMATQFFLSSLSLLYSDPSWHWQDWKLLNNPPLQGLSKLLSCNWVLHWAIITPNSIWIIAVSIIFMMSLKD